MESRFFLDVVIGQSSPILQLLSREDQSLLVGGNPFLVLDFGLDILDGVRALDLEGDGLSGEGLDEDLHASTKTEHQVKGRLLLDVVVSEGAPIFQLFAGENQALLIGGNSFLVLNFLLDGINGVMGLNFQSDGLSGEGLDENLHSATQSEYQVKSRFLLDVVIGEGSAIFELLSSENKTLLIRGDSFLVLNFLLNSVDGVVRFNFQGNGLTSESFHEDLHTTSQSKDQMQSGFLLDVVISKSSSVLKLLSGENESLLVRGDSFLILNLLLDGINGVVGFDFQSDRLSGQSLHEDLHTTAQSEH